MPVLWVYPSTTSGFVRRLSCDRVARLRAKLPSSRLALRGTVATRGTLPLQRCSSPETATRPLMLMPLQPSK